MSYQRLGDKVAGWWVDTELLNPNSIVYSFGLGVNITFELALIEARACAIHGFDPTPGEVQKYLSLHKNPLLTVHLVGLAAEDRIATFTPLHPDWATFTEFSEFVREKCDVSAQVQLKSLKTVMRELKHDRIDLLKMDIEGAEYEVIHSVFGEYTKPTIGQILVEWHGDNPENAAKRAACEDILQKAGFILEENEDINSSYKRKSQ